MTWLASDLRGKRIENLWILTQNGKSSLGHYISTELQFVCKHIRQEALSLLAAISSHLCYSKNRC